MSRARRSKTAATPTIAGVAVLMSCGSGEDDQQDDDEDEGAESDVHLIASFGRRFRVGRVRSSAGLSFLYPGCAVAK
jgi:hypothetical protein